jgi:hypothetical protein
MNSRILILLFLVIFAPSVSRASDDITFGRSDLTIVTTTGAKYHFALEVAQTPEQLERGLMFRDSMPDDAGMLFLLGDEEIASFWMRNTFLPLDMIFIAKDGRITNIHRNAAPGSTAIISSTALVTAVLEVNGGVTQRLGIRAGDRILHPSFP